MAYGARLESVLGATPQGFESLILRFADQALCRVLLCVSVITLRVWSQFRSTREGLKPPDQRIPGYMTGFAAD